MRRSFPRFTMIFSDLAILGTTLGVRAALNSDLFVVRVVEVSEQVEGAPLDSREVTALAAVPLGETSLFDLNLSAIEKRLLSNHWVRSVVLIKRFPQTLAIQVDYRKPVALLQGAHGVLKYVDEDGSLFGPVTLRGSSDLPIIDGLSADQSLIKSAVSVLRDWAEFPWKTSNQISQISWDEDEGFTVWISYAPANRVSVLIGPDWGQTPEAQDRRNPDAFSDGLARIDQVLTYSSRRGIPVRQIFADANKKIVVRTDRRS